MMSACNLPPVLATLEATIIDPNDTSGSGSSYAVVNFTQFYGVTSNGGGAELRFTNPEGDSMTITLSETSMGSFSIGALTQVSGQITITRDLQPVTQAFTASAGNIVITGIATDGDEVIAAQGNFEINIEGGGGATSRFDGR
ncbi:MAG TPA: hypothetical protein PKC21_00145 [Oligoflexia bacterium]|nr:hypothetical protein [Oligoflexia bacterium]HMR23736.1 hypothetical protein [Oligoflexia bacterium]